MVKMLRNGQCVNHKTVFVESCLQDGRPMQNDSSRIIECLLSGDRDFNGDDCSTCACRIRPWRILARAWTLDQFQVQVWWLLSFVSPRPPSVMIPTPPIHYSLWLLNKKKINTFISCNNMLRFFFFFPESFNIFKILKKLKNI